MEPTVANTILVVGIGTATVNPEIADLSIGLHATGDAPGTALAEVTAVAQAVLAAAHDHGISDSGLRTQGVSVHARIDPYSSEIDGYVAVYTLRLRVTQIVNASLVIDAVTQAAGDALRLGGLDLVPADTAAARTTAAVNAVADARSRAERLAEKAGVRLGPVISIIEEALAQHGPKPAVMLRAARSMAGAPAPIQAGSDEIIAHVGVTFHIGDLSG